MKKIHTITVISENKPGVLYRIADLFLRRKINVEELHVGKTKNPNISLFTIKIEDHEDVIEKVVKQINKIIEVYEAKYE